MLALRFNLSLRFAVACCCLALGGGARASDHADPLLLHHLESGIADLFAFPRDDRLVLILTARRGLNGSGPIDADEVTYSILLDLDSEVSYSDPRQVARYGGGIVEPEGIRPEVQIDARLNEDASLRSFSTSGLVNDVNATAEINEPHLRAWSGIRDDPFIFFRFQGSNVIALVVEIALSEFPSGQREFLVWGTSSRCDRQVDHVGRSMRTMAPRLDFLNTLPPSLHTEAIERRRSDPGVVQDVLGTFAQPFFGIRDYDVAPDVLVLSLHDERAIGYPNGRRLEDDVADLACQSGDCLLYEVSQAEAEAAGADRPTENDRAFLDGFPYLAEPNPESRPRPTNRLRLRTIIILTAVGLTLLGLVLLPWWLLYRKHRLLTRLREQVAMP